MKLYIAILFGILFHFIDLILLPLIWPFAEIPDLVIILCIYLIAYNEEDHVTLFANWLLGLLKDCISVEPFGLYAMAFVLISFLLLKLKQTIHLTNKWLIGVLVFFFTFQYHLIHSMIIFVRKDVDLTYISILSALYTAMLAPFVVPVLHIFNNKNRDNYFG